MDVVLVPGKQMRELPVDDSMRRAWKHYPLRLSGLKGSRCHGLPTLLVQSMEGGFVTRNCPACGGPETLPEADFMMLGLWVACPSCRAPMTPGRVPRSNYGYTCKTCDVYIKLSALLPTWDDMG